MVTSQWVCLDFLWGSINIFIISRLRNEKTLNTFIFMMLNISSTPLFYLFFWISLELLGPGKQPMGIFGFLMAPYQYIYDFPFTE